MTGWIAFAVSTTVAVALAVLLNRRHTDQLTELRDRAHAELEDVRTDARGRVDRLQRESTRQRQDARDALLDDLFPALDALVAAREQLGETEVATGIAAVYQQFARALARHDITEIAPQPGEPFDATTHEAVDVVDTTEHPPGHVVRCHRVGFRAGEKVLRPALVGVVRRADRSSATARSEEE